MGRSIEAEEAAARLGVKRATLYAYVSRGLLSRTPHPDGRRSLFDANEVEALRARSRRQVRGELGAIVTTRVSRVDETRPRLAGRPLAACLDAGLEDTLARLWGAPLEHPPLPRRLAASIARAARALPPGAALTDRLGLALTLARAHDPLRDEDAPATRERLLAALLEALPPRQDTRPTDLAHRLWVRLSPRRGTRAQRAALEASWVALLDHGLATSTFAVRVAASTRADLYACVAAGLGALGGPLHGAASRGVHALLEAAAEQGAERALGERLRGGVLPGVGHSVYRQRDPREALLMARIEAGWGQQRRFEVVRALRRALTARQERLVNVDFALGALSWLAGMEPEAGEALFAIARLGGWCAHVAEERREPPLRFRPQARYAGD